MGGPRRRASGSFKAGNAGGSWERDCSSSHLSPEGCGDVGMWEEAKGKETLASVLQQFLRASLDTMEDEAWTKGLSCELSRWLSSSASSSGEKVGSRGCGWCSAHTGRLCCFPGPCPPEGFSLQTARGWLKLGPAAALSISQGAWVLPPWPSPSRSGCCHISASSFPSLPIPSLPFPCSLSCTRLWGQCWELVRKSSTSKRSFCNTWRKQTRRSHLRPR